MSVEQVDDDLITSWGLVEEGFRNAHGLIVSEIEEQGLSIQSFEVLLRLLRTPDHQLPMNRLASDIAMTSGGYTKLVDRMEAAGLVQRVPAVDDRRVIFTALTDAGRETAERVLRSHCTHLRSTVLAPLSGEQVATLASIMRTLRDAHAVGGDTEPASAPADDAIDEPVAVGAQATAVPGTNGAPATLHAASTAPAS